MIYDLIVLGGGPAGYLGAERAGEAGFKTLLIEKRSLGGVCLNEGCIPTKTLLYSAKIYDNAIHGEKYGVIPESVRFNHGKVIDRKNKTVRTLVAGIKAQLKKSNVDVAEGFGEIIGRSNEGYQVKVADEKETGSYLSNNNSGNINNININEIHKDDKSKNVQGIQENSKLFIGKRLLIATGSMPILPPISGVKEGIEKGFVLTNREILDMKEVPRSLVIVGGGVIGLEMASYFNSAGSKVTVVEMLDHIAGNTDREISGILMRNYEKKGVAFKLGACVTAVKDGFVTYEYKENGTDTPKSVSVEADKVLMSIGRKPVVDGFGLDRIGVEIEKGHVKVDERGRTNVPGVYAAGDVNGYSMLAHTAYREAEVCINNMLGKKDIMRYNAVPYVIYTNPEVAGVGETEESALQKQMDIKVSKIPMTYSGRYVAENEGGDGICKVLIEKNTRRLIGLHMISNYSSEIIYGAAAMIEMEMRIDDIKEVIFPHPTVSEIIKEAIFKL